MVLDTKRLELAMFVHRGAGEVRSVGERESGVSIVESTGANVSSSR